MNSSELAKAMTEQAAQVGSAIEALVIRDVDGDGPFANHDLPRPQCIDEATADHSQAHAFELELADGSTYRVEVVPLTGPTERTSTT